MGFRYDSRTGEYKIMDVNPRIGSSFRLFAAVDGTDVARAMYLHRTGCPIPCSHAVEGRKWLTEDFDLFSTMRSFSDGALSPWEWLRSFQGVQELACFAVDDPLPAFMMAISDCREFWKWVRRRGAARDRAAQAPLPALSANSRRR
jgi:D-aspartate ligase